MGVQIKNMLVMIDYENMHCNLRSKFKNVFEVNFFPKFKKFINDNAMNALDIVAYCNFDLDDMYPSFHQSKLHEFGIETRHTSNNGKNFADIQITVDVMNLIYSNTLIDGIILISDDKDMTPLIKSIKKQKGLVYLITSQNSGDLILESPTHHGFFEDILDIPFTATKLLSDDMYENLNNHIQKDYVDKKKLTPLLSLERFMENSLRWYKVFEYEIIRNLQILEKDGKIFIHKYKMTDGEGREYGKEHMGIITDSFLYLFKETKPLTITNNFFSNTYLHEVYAKFIKKS